MQHETNKIIIIFSLIFGFLKSLVESIILFIKSLFGSKGLSPLKENRFLDALNFSLHTGPKVFWKKPSGIKIGRSISTFIRYVFEKERYFKEIKKFDK